MLCTDGGVLYLDASSDCDQFPNNEGKVLSCSGLGESCFGVGLLKDAVALSYNPDRDTAWALRRVTANGALLLLRATQDDDSCVIEVSPLRGYHFIIIVMLPRSDVAIHAVLKNITVS